MIFDGLKILLYVYKATVLSNSPYNQAERLLIVILYDKFYIQLC